MEKKKLTGTFVVGTFLIWTGGQQQVVSTHTPKTSVCVCVYVCPSVKDFTLTDLGCQVLQEGVVQQLGKVFQNQGKARFGVVLTHHVLQLLLVGPAARVVLHSQTAHLRTSQRVVVCVGPRLSGPGSGGVGTTHPDVVPAEDIEGNAVPIGIGTSVGEDQDHAVLLPHQLDGVFQGKLQGLACVRGLGQPAQVFHRPGRRDKRALIVF